MFAIIRTGGKQYRVSEKDTLKVEKLSGKAGDVLELSDVLLVEKENDVTLGRPVVEGAKVMAKIVKHGLGKKIDIIKFKSKVRYRRKSGHRQPFTEILIEKISA